MSKSRLVSQQQGMVAIITTMILMIVVSLIVLGFSQVVRRNQRQALDAQLSSQAFYAAESGLNYARKMLSTNADFTQNNCVPDSGAPAEYTLDTDSSTKITCLLVQPVRDVQLNNVSGDSRTAIIDPDGTDPVGNIYINWESTVSDPSAPPVCTGDGTTLPTAEAWQAECDQPLLRIDLVPISETGIDRGTLISEQYTAFLYPRTSGGASSSAIGPSKGELVSTQCTVDIDAATNKRKKCMIQLTGATAQMYAIRVLNVNGRSNVAIHTEGDPILKGSQMLVDSTGRSVDVLKRVQARVPVGGGRVPNFAINSNQGACKLYQVIAGVADETACDEPPATP